MTLNKNIMTAERSALEDNARDHINALEAELERKDTLVAMQRALIVDLQAEIKRLDAGWQTANTEALLITQSLKELEQMLTSVSSALPPIKYGCHCDLDPEMDPDGCVLDLGRPNDCVYARCGDKTICKYWLPMTPENRTKGTF